MTSKKLKQVSPRPRRQLSNPHILLRIRINEGVKWTIDCIFWMTFYTNQNHMSDRQRDKQLINLTPFEYFIRLIGRDGKKSTFAHQYLVKNTKPHNYLDAENTNKISGSPFKSAFPKSTWNEWFSNFGRLSDEASVRVCEISLLAPGERIV